MRGVTPLSASRRYARHGGQWFRFDDSWVTRADPGEVSAAEAYLLFYVAHSATSPDPKPPEGAQTAAAGAKGEGAGGGGGGGAKPAAAASLSFGA